MRIRIEVLVAVLSVFSAAINCCVATDELPETIRVATWNVEWFFDDFKPDNRSDLGKNNSAPSKAEWEWKLDQVARVVAELEPTILALQEVENRDVIFKLTKVLEEKHKLKYRYAFIDGTDFGTEQDVAFIYKSGLVEYSRREQTQEMFDSKDYYNLSKHLFARFEWGPEDSRQELVVATLHFRAMPEEEELRKRQGRLLHSWIKPALLRGENVIVLGDINTEHRADKPIPDSDLGVLCGWNTSETNDDLTDLHTSLPVELRNTHLIGREFDRILVSSALTVDDPSKKDLVFTRIISRKDLVVVGEQDKEHMDVYYQIPQAERDVSDHYPLMAEFAIK